MPDKTLAAPEAVNDEPVNPHEITSRGVYIATSAIHAVLPAPMVQRCVENAGVKATADGLWLFEQTSRIDTDNLVLKIRPRGQKYFDTMTPYAHPDEFTNLKLAARELGNVVPFASTYRRLARIHSWPTLLYVWTDEEAIFIRKAFTEEVWEMVGRNTIANRAYILAHKALFGLLPATV